MTIKATRIDAMQLLMEGSKALAQVEANGIRIDTAYLAKAEKKVIGMIDDLEEELRKDDVYKLWKKTFGSDMKLSKDKQLGFILFETLGYPPKAFTDITKQYKTDKIAFELINIPFTKKYIKWKEFIKARDTFLKEIREETIDGYIHPFQNLHIARTYRNCIAKGTMIEVVRDVSKYPDGIPIEKVKVGDYAYCYDDNLNLTIKKVIWTGKTGKKKVIRVHWGTKGRKGYVDLTPEHKVRLASGEYIEAQNLMGGLRTKNDSKHKRKISVLSMGRGKSGARRDRVYQTGGRNEGIFDHKLVYETLIGELEEHEIIHHKDENHLNNDPHNLQKTNHIEHARIHVHKSLPPEVRKRGLESIIKMIATGEIAYKKGEDNPLWLSVSKFGLLRMLSKAEGHPSKLPHDFEVMRRKAKMLGIDWMVVKDRYDSRGKYITRGRIKSKKSRVEMIKEFGNFYKVNRMLKQRNINYKNVWINQFGSGLLNNHFITKVEWINKEVDVYDIEVEEFHNFIAGEICVHNSSDSPNAQNWPVRNKEISELIRSCFIPRDGCVLLEHDFGSHEVKISACYNHDPALIKYINDPNSDMHLDLAMDVFILPKEEVSKDIRFYAKNQFTFAEFYGSFYKQCAPLLWQSMERFELKTTSGRNLLEHLAEKGIKKIGLCEMDFENPKSEPKKGTFEYHLRNVEKRLWDKFKVYAQWKKDCWEKYKIKGYVDYYTGFRVQGVMSRNAVLSYPIQGSASHCELWTLIELNKWIQKNKMKSKIVNTIHDCTLSDVPRNEVDDVNEKIRELGEKEIRKKWPWIIVPLSVETEICEINWFKKDKFDPGKWRVA